MREAILRMLDDDGNQKAAAYGTLTRLQMPTLSFNARFKDAASDAEIRARFFDQAAEAWRIERVSEEPITGHFLISSLEYAGEDCGEASFKISLRAVGSDPQ